MSTTLETTDYSTVIAADAELDRTRAMQMRLSALLDELDYQDCMAEQAYHAEQAEAGYAELEGSERAA